MRRITLLLVDDHNVIRQGLRALLRFEPNFEIVGEAASGREAVALAQRLSPNVIVMDLAMPLLNGMEATRQIIRAWPRTKIVVLSAYDDAKYVEPVIAAGAAAYLRKDAAANELIAAVREVVSGKAYFSPEISRLRQKHASEGDHQRKEPLEVKLSFREAEVLQLIAEGFGNKQIASELNITVKTAQNYRRSIMVKLNVHSVVGLVHYAVRTGIIEMHPTRSILN